MPTSLINIFQNELYEIDGKLEQITLYQDQADLTETGKDGKTLLHYAVQYKHDNFIKYLLNRYPALILKTDDNKINAFGFFGKRDHQQRTLYYYAAKYDAIKCFYWLKDQGEISDPTKILINLPPLYIKNPAGFDAFGEKNQTETTYFGQVYHELFLLYYFIKLDAADCTQQLLADNPGLVLQKYKYKKPALVLAIDCKSTKCIEMLVKKYPHSAYTPFILKKTDTLDNNKIKITEEEQTPIEYVILQNNLTVIKQLHNLNIDINHNNPTSLYQPITLALRNRYWNTLTWMLSAGDIMLDDKLSLVCYAVLSIGEPDTLIYLKNQLGNVFNDAFYYRFPDHLNLISYIIEQEDIDLLKWLINEEIIDINKPIFASTQNCPVHIATQLGNKEIINLLLQKGASVLVANDNGQYPLHIAAENNNIILISKLIEKYSIDIDLAETKTGNTLAHIAVLQDSENILQYVIDEGANLNQANAEGKCPIHLAAELDNDNLFEMLMNTEAVSITAKVVNTQDSIMHIIARYGHIALFEMIYYRYSEFEIIPEILVTLNEENKEGLTPFLTAIQYGQPGIVKKFLEISSPESLLTSTYGTDEWQPVHHLSRIPQRLLNKSFEIDPSILIDSLIELFNSYNKLTNVTKNGDTVLHLLLKSIITEKLNNEVFNKLFSEFIIYNNSLVTIKNKNQETVLHILMQILFISPNKFQNILRILIDNKITIRFDQLERIDHKQYATLFSQTINFQQVFEFLVTNLPLSYQIIVTYYADLLLTETFFNTLSENKQQENLQEFCRVILNMGFCTGRQLTPEQIKTLGFVFADEKSIPFSILAIGSNIDKALDYQQELFANAIIKTEELIPQPDNKVTTIQMLKAMSISLLSAIAANNMDIIDSLKSAFIKFINAINYIDETLFKLVNMIIAYNNNNKNIIFNPQESTDLNLKINQLEIQFVNKISRAKGIIPSLFNHAIETIAANGLPTKLLTVDSEKDAKNNLSKLYPARTIVEVAIIDKTRIRGDASSLQVVKALIDQSIINNEAKLTTKKRKSASDEKSSKKPKSEEDLGKFSKKY